MTPFSLRRRRERWESGQRLNECGALWRSEGGVLGQRVGYPFGERLAAGVMEVQVHKEGSSGLAVHVITKVEAWT